MKVTARLTYTSMLPEHMILLDTAQCTGLDNSNIAHDMLSNQGDCNTTFDACLLEGKGLQSLSVHACHEKQQPAGQ